MFSSFYLLSDLLLRKYFFSVVMSEDMVKDGYEDIMNIDISSVAVDMMRRKYEYIPQLKCILLTMTESSIFFRESLPPLLLFL